MSKYDMSLEAAKRILAKRHYYGPSTILEAERIVRKAGNQDA